MKTDDRFRDLDDAALRNARLCLLACPRCARDLAAVALADHVFACPDEDCARLEGTFFIPECEHCADRFVPRPPAWSAYCSDDCLSSAAEAYDDMRRRDHEMGR